MIRSMISPMKTSIIKSMVNPDSGAVTRVFIDLDGTHYELDSTITFLGDFFIDFKFSTSVAPGSTSAALMGQALLTQNFIQLQNGGSNISVNSVGGTLNIPYTAHLDGRLHSGRIGREGTNLYFDLDEINLGNHIVTVNPFVIDWLGALSLGGVPSQKLDGILADTVFNDLEGLRAIQERLLIGQQAGSGYNYIITGDSTRDNSYNRAIDYYTDQLSKIDWAVTDNALSGQDATEWINDTFAPLNGITAALTATPNTGVNSILEFSFGINDVGSQAVIKTALKLALDTYIAARPDTLIVLVTPVTTSDTVKTAELKATYFELGIELSLPVVDVESIMSPVHGDADFYWDAVHPNRWGSVRMINYILNKEVHPNLYPLLTIEDVVGQPPTTGNIAEPVEVNRWDTFTGNTVIDPTWRRMQEVAVEPDQQVKITHGGNRTEIAYLDASKVWLGRANIINDYIYTIPEGAYYLQINISDDGVTYDALGDVPSITYFDVLTQDESNIGVDLSNQGLQGVTTLSLNEPTANSELSEQGNNTANYIAIPTTDREEFKLSSDKGQWDNISPEVQQLPAVIEIA